MRKLRAIVLILRSFVKVQIGTVEENLVGVKDGLATILVINQETTFVIVASGRFRMLRHVLIQLATVRNNLIPDILRNSLMRKVMSITDWSTLLD
jgi:hypothetical protein